MRACWRGDDRISLSVPGCRVRNVNRACTWSCRFLPTAGRDDHLAPRPDALDGAALLHLDADGTPAFEQNPPHMRARHQLEVPASQVGLEIALSRRTAPAVAHVELNRPH